MPSADELYIAAKTGAEFFDFGQVASLPRFWRSPYTFEGLPLLERAYILAIS